MIVSPVYTVTSMHDIDLAIVAGIAEMMKSGKPVYLTVDYHPSVASRLSSTDRGIKRILKDPCELEFLALQQTWRTDVSRFEISLVTRYD
jgi:hypothetical protein